MNCVIRASHTNPATEPVEIVERKGFGHPDTICDALAEQVSIQLSRHYEQRFGRVLHHNVDKVLLVGGSTRAWLGGGQMDAPIEIYLAGRATEEYRGERVPIHDIAIEACTSWLRTHLPHLDGDHAVDVVSRIRGGSHSLTSLFQRADEIPLANDTSIGVGFAPYSELERIVLRSEAHLRDANVKRMCPPIGEDIKIMATRYGSAVDLTVACAALSRRVSTLEDYRRFKAHVSELVAHVARRETALDVSVRTNVGDGDTADDIYLTLTGTSAEAGDDGEVGRGNRTSGLITPYRPMTLEAAAGKNPVNHVGKLYNVVATRVASAIVSELTEISSAECVMVSAIGRPVTDPQCVDLRLTSRLGLIEIEDRVRDIVARELAAIPQIREELLRGEVALF